MEAAIPDCEVAHLREALERHNGDGNAALEAVLSAPYPKRQKRPRLGSSASSSAQPAEPASSSSEPVPPPPPPIVDLDPDNWFDLEKRQAQRGPGRGTYKKEALELLANEFVELTRPSVGKALETNANIYAVSWRALQDILGVLLEGRQLPPGMKRLKCPRKRKPERDVKTLKCARLRDEVLFVRYWREKEQIESKQRALREAYLKRCEEEGLLVECECCFTESPPDEVAQCSAGHLFCTRCVAHFVEQQLGTNEVHCIQCPSISECPEQLPPGELRRCLPPLLWDGLQKRLQRSSIQGLLEDSVGGAVEQCPFCDFVMVMDAPKEVNKVFVCYSEECGKESCRLCKEENHIPRRCEEVEKRAQTSHRLAVEERMSEALIRHCPACRRNGLNSKILKEEGCNKMTCPNKKCRAFFCYQCNAEIPKQVGYGHFCQHPIEPGRKCPCGLCSLWTNQDFQRDEEQRVVNAGMAFHQEYLAEHLDDDLNDELEVLQGAVPDPKAQAKARARRHRRGNGNGRGAGP